MNMLIRLFILLNLLKRQQKKASSEQDVDKNVNNNELQSTQKNEKSDHDTYKDKNGLREAGDIKTVQHAMPNKALAKKVLEPFERSYRILPHDMGFRDHLPNYRFLSFVELNITGWLTQCLYAMPEVDNEYGKINWVISMQEMVYLKQVKLFDKILVKSHVEGWDSKYLYFQHHFYVDGNVMAIGLTKFVLMNHEGKLSPAVLGLHNERLSMVITTWNVNQDAIKQQK